MRTAFMEAFSCQVKLAQSILAEIGNSQSGLRVKICWPHRSAGGRVRSRILPAGRRSRGCCQWVLDTACQVGEWLHQPLQVNSPPLCVPLTKKLDNHFAAAHDWNGLASRSVFSGSPQRALE